MGLTLRIELPAARVGLGKQRLFAIQQTAKD
jgi:hypothetical protein